MVQSYKYLGVQLDNKLDGTGNIDVLYKKGQSRLYFLRRLSSFGVCRTLLNRFYQSVVASTILYAVVCWGGSIKEGDRKRLNRLIKKAGSVLGTTLDTVEEVANNRTRTKLLAIMDNPSHPLHDTVKGQKSTFSNRLLHPSCKNERYRKSFLPTAIRLYNSTSGWLEQTN